MPNRVSPGQHFLSNPLVKDSNTVNDVLGMLDSFKATELGRHGSAGPMIRSAPLGVNEIKIKTPATPPEGKDAFETGMVIEVGDYVLNAEEIEQHSFWFEGEAIPASPKFLAIIKRGDEPEQIVTATIAGVCAARVNVSDVAHKYAKTTEDSYVLASATSGPFKLLSTPTETGEQLMAALFAPRQTALAKNGLSAIPARSGTTLGSGTVTLQELDGTSLVATSETPTIYNMSGSEIAVGAYLQLKMINGVWFADVEDCGA